MKHSSLLSSDFICFTTRDYALANEQSIQAASRSLNRMAKNKILTRLTKGIWANTKHPYFSPLGCVPYLLGSEQGYVSFLTALHRQDALSQIPATIQVATTGHSRRLKTPVGTYEFFKLSPKMMLGGVDWSESKLPYRVASPEKALLDTLYLSTRRGRRFSSLPEIELNVLKRGKFLTLLKSQVPFSLIRKVVLERLKQVGL